MGRPHTVDARARAHRGVLASVCVCAACRACRACCRNKNLGDGIDYGQQQYDCLGELCNDTLILMEQHGGPDAFINIRYMIPTCK